MMPTSLKHPMAAQPTERASRKPALQTRTGRLGPTRSPTRPLSRRGTTLVEIIVSSILLTTIVVTVAPLLGWVAGQRRAAAQRQFALQEAENLMERVTLLEWTELTPEKLSQSELSAAAADVLPGRQLTVTVDDDNEGAAAAKRVQITLTWQDRTGETVAPVRLTSWFFQQEAAQ